MHTTVYKIWTRFASNGCKQYYLLICSLWQLWSILVYLASKKHEERNRHKDRQKYLIKIHPTCLFGPTRLIGTWEYIIEKLTQKGFEPMMWKVLLLLFSFNVQSQVFSPPMRSSKCRIQWQYNRIVWPLFQIKPRMCNKTKQVIFFVNFRHIWFFQSRLIFVTSSNLVVDLFLRSETQNPKFVPCST